MVSARALELAAAITNSAAIENKNRGMDLPPNEWTSYNSRWPLVALAAFIDTARIAGTSIPLSCVCAVDIRDMLLECQSLFRDVTQTPQSPRFKRVP